VRRFELLNCKGGASISPTQILFAFEEALRILIPFATSYLCDAGFSAVAVIKQSIARRYVEREMRSAVSNITSHFALKEAS